jgi:hypothetical protein
MAADRVSHAYTKMHPARARGKSAQEYLVIEMFVRRGSLSRDPTELLIPHTSGDDILEVVDSHNRIKAHQPGNQGEQLSGSEWGLRPDLQADGNLASVHFHPSLSSCGAQL